MLGLVRELLGLDEFFRSLARELSLGQRMRADLGLSLVHDPEILFLDEPTLGLDVLAKRNILEFIKQLNRERRMTVLVTSLIGAFQIFEPVQLITKGGPFNTTNVMLNQIYNDAFVNSNFGVASAGATLMGVILLAASYTVLRSMREEEA